MSFSEYCAYFIIQAECFSLPKCLAPCELSCMSQLAKQLGLKTVPNPGRPNELEIKCLNIFALHVNIVPQITKFKACFFARRQAASIIVATDAVSKHGHTDAMEF